MLPLVWRAEARADLLDIIAYIGERNLSAAERLLAIIEHTAEQLSEHPFLYRPGRVPGTREAVVHHCVSGRYCDRDIGAAAYPAAISIKGTHPTVPIFPVD